MRISDWSSDVCSSDLPKGIPGIAESSLMNKERLAQRLGRRAQWPDEGDLGVHAWRLAHYIASLPTSPLLVTHRRWALARSEERRGGKGCGRTWRAGWWK